MGWDSDSEGSIDIDAQLAAKNQPKKSQLDVEEEQALKAAVTKAPVVAAKPKPAPAAVSSGPVVEVVTRTYDVDEIATSDPQAEKLRMKRLQEKSEMALMDDLFAGCEKPDNGTAEGSSIVREVIKTIKEDSFEKLQLITTKEIEGLASRCGSKVLNSDVKSAPHKFVLEVIRSVGHALTVTDLTQLQKTLKDLSIAKQREQAEKLAGKKKLSTDVAQMKKGAKIDVFDAIGEVYGGDDYDNYDEDY